MEQKLFVYNTLACKKKLFKPLHALNVGMYVYGPTIYGDPHLGHAHPAVTLGILFRYLKHLGYRVYYVRNITDVGHLGHNADEGDDKIEKKARLEQSEPMEIAQLYTNRYYAAMDALNVPCPSIEPRATGHIIKQEELVKQILTDGYVYENNGSVYFDIEKYNKDRHYDILSGRNLDDVINNSRELDGVDEKRNQVDFALWKCAMPKHIMRWPSPWSDGFLGWHCECTAVGCKYLGNHSDIHGGGMDLVFPHYECEIAQAVASQGDQMVRYQIRNSMITINEKKMGKSLGNFITLEQFFHGTYNRLMQAYLPMTIRFFILSAHYRSTVDFSNKALQANEERLERLMNDISGLERIQAASTSDETTHQLVVTLRQKCHEAMNDDLQTPTVISNLFEACHAISSLLDHKSSINTGDLTEPKAVMQLLAFDLLGLKSEKGSNNDACEMAYGKVVDMVLPLRAKAKVEKDWATSDQIRDALAENGFEVKGTKDGTTWKLNR